MKESCVECRHHDVFWGGAGCNLLNNGERCKFEPLQEPAEGRRMNKKAVLISIRPKWCEMIANGEKTVEVRKTRPKLEPPFKCYIYCTNKKPFLVWGEVFRWNWETEFTRLYGYSRKKAEEIWDVFNGRIMGEFICDDIRYTDAFNFVVKEDGEKALEGSCIDEADLFEYLGWEKGMPRAECAPFYRWHISDLEVYDTPVELREFTWTRKTRFGTEFVPITRPPQSWCYVEDLGNKIANKEET